MDGSPFDKSLLAKETVSADTLRAKAIANMVENVSFYEGFGRDAVNADLPLGMAYTSLWDRINAMSFSSSHVGEFEILAAARASHCTIIVHQVGLPKRVYGTGQQRYLVRFTPLGDGVGHYDSLVEE